MSTVDPCQRSQQVEAALAEPGVPPGLAALTRMMLALMLSMHQQLEQLLRAQYGRRSERTKVPGAEKIARKQGDKPAPRKPKTPIDAHALPSETVEHAVPDEARHCTV